MQATIGYTFADNALLQRALTHRSRVSDHTESYEALETVGDAIISLLAVKYAYDRLASPTPQDMTRLRSSATRNATLARIGEEMGVATAVQMVDKGDGGGGKDGVVADCVEALFGAVWIDADLDLDTVQRLFDQYFSSYIVKPPSRCVDPKTRLQIYCQQMHKSPPQYSLVSQHGPPHHPVFTTEVSHPNDALVVGTGIGGSKRESETAAAKEAIAALKATGHKSLSMSPAESRRKFSACE